MADVMGMNGIGVMHVTSEDNECAQALLELAMSSFYAPPVNTKLAYGMSGLKRQMTVEEEEREELVKKIKLDHCYFWDQTKSIEYSQGYCDSMVFPQQHNGTLLATDDVDISFLKYPPGIKTGKENALDMVAKWRMDNIKREKKVALKSNVLHTKIYAEYIE